MNLKKKIIVYECTGTQEPFESFRNRNARKCFKITIKNYWFLL